MSLFKALFSTPPQPVSKHYRSKNGRHIFTFKFVPEGNRVSIYCQRHPPLNGRDSSAHKTHLFSSGKICFVAGREPRDLSSAMRLAQQWGEYLLEYIRTGVPQS
jgi:hypothetical protein